MSEQTRSCQPGDVLASGAAPCGAEWEITVQDDSEHPDSGTTDYHKVNLRLWVYVPSTNAYIDKPLRDPRVSVLQDGLNCNWGRMVSGEVNRRTAAFNRRSIDRYTDNIASTVAELSAIGADCIATVQAVSDAHFSSRARQIAARDAIYASWPVRV